MPGRMIRFLAETGKRHEQVCALQWSQASLARREVGLAKTKTSNPRALPLSARHAITESGKSEWPSRINALRPKPSAVIAGQALRA